MGSRKRNNDYEFEYTGNSSSKKSGGDECDISFQDQIQNPQHCITSVVVGEILFIMRGTNGSIQVHSNNGLCGYLTSPQSQDIAYCIIKKRTYKAEVLKIQGLNCVVKITLDE